MQLRSPNLTEKRSTVSPRNSFILGSKGQRSSSRGTKSSASVCFCTLVSACLFYFIFCGSVVYLFLTTVECRTWQSWNRVTGHWVTRSTILAVSLCQTHSLSFIYAFVTALFAVLFYMTAAHNSNLLFFCQCFITLYVANRFKIIPLGCTRRTRNVLPNFSHTSHAGDVRQQCMTIQWNYSRPISILSYSPDGAISYILYSTLHGGLFPYFIYNSGE